MSSNKKKCKLITTLLNMTLRQMNMKVKAFRSTQLSTSNEKYVMGVDMIQQVLTICNIVSWEKNYNRNWTNNMLKLSRMKIIKRWRNQRRKLTLISKLPVGCAKRRLLVLFSLGLLIVLFLIVLWLNITKNAAGSHIIISACKKSVMFLFGSRPTLACSSKRQRDSTSKRLALNLRMSSQR